MSPVAAKIYAKIQTLTKEQDNITNQIKQLNHAIETGKKTIHRTELSILVYGGTDHSDLGAGKLLANEMSNLSQEKREQHSAEASLKILTEKSKTLNQEIEHCKFWMHRADSTDVVRQKEAEKAIFG